MSKQEYDKLVRPKTSLIDFFANSPLSEIELDLERSKDGMRDKRIGSLRFKGFSN